MAGWLGRLLGAGLQEKAWRRLGPGSLDPATLVVAGSTPSTLLPPDGPRREGFSLGPGYRAGGHHRAAEEDFAHAAGALQVQAGVCATAGTKLRRQKRGKDLGAGIWHLVTPPLSLSPGNSASKNPSSPRNPASGIPGPLRRPALSPEPLHFDIEVWALGGPGIPALCSLDESCLYSPGISVPFPLWPLLPRICLTRTYSLEPHTLIPGTTTLLQGSLISGSLASPRISPLTSPSPCLCHCRPWAVFPPTHTWFVPPQVSSARR